MPIARGRSVSRSGRSARGRGRSAECRACSSRPPGSLSQLSSSRPLPHQTQALGLPKVTAPEPADECLLSQDCIDQYLWSLYERARKIDTVKVSERFKVTVKKEGQEADGHKNSYQACRLKTSRGRTRMPQRKRACRCRNTSSAAWSEASE